MAMRSLATTPPSNLADSEIVARNSEEISSQEFLENIIKTFTESRILQVIKKLTVYPLRFLPSVEFDQWWKHGLVCLLVGAFLPEIMTYPLFALCRLTLGTLYPAYASYKAVRTKNVREYVKWMMYWIVFALFTSFEVFADIFIAFWFPFYYELKIVLLLWLISPVSRGSLGSSMLYRKLVHPQLMKREEEIDRYLGHLQERGYNTVTTFAARGLEYLTSLIMQTAIRGGGGLVQTLRKSYSLTDLDQVDGGDDEMMTDSRSSSRVRAIGFTSPDTESRESSVARSRIREIPSDDTGVYEDWSSAGSGGGGRGRLRDPEMENQSPRRRFRPQQSRSQSTELSREQRAQSESLYQPNRTSPRRRQQQQQQQPEIKGSLTSSTAGARMKRPKSLAFDDLDSSREGPIKATEDDDSYVLYRTKSTGQVTSFDRVGHQVRNSSQHATTPSPVKSSPRYKSYQEAKNSPRGQMSHAYSEGGNLSKKKAKVTKVMRPSSGGSAASRARKRSSFSPSYEFDQRLLIDPSDSEELEDWYE